VVARVPLEYDHVPVPAGWMTAGHVAGRTSGPVGTPAGVATVQAHGAAGVFETIPAPPRQR
jgi:hypothetical protein